MQRQCLVIAQANGRGCKGRGIVAAACQHHLGAVIQGVDDGFHAHLCHDMGAGQDLFFGDFRSRTQLCHFPGVEGFHQVFLLKFGSNHSQLERQVVLLGDFFQDAHFPHQVRIGTGTAAGTDDQGDIQLPGSFEHQGHVPLDGGGIGKGNARAQVIGAGVGRTGITGDEVRLLCHTGKEGFLRESVTHDTGAGKDFHFFFHGITPYGACHSEACKASRGNPRSHRGTDCHAASLLAMTAKNRKP